MTDSHPCDSPIDDSTPGDSPTTGNAGFDGWLPDRPDAAQVAARLDPYTVRTSLIDALAQGVTLTGEIERLAGLLAQERLRYANLWAAVRAALHAAEDGEADPQDYLRMECPDLIPHPASDPADLGPDARGWW